MNSLRSGLGPRPWSAARFSPKNSSSPRWAAALIAFSAGQIGVALIV
jgi:hypothetical protein